MFDGGWFSLSRGRAALFMLALFGLGYLFLQARPLQTEISGWRGGAFSNSAGAGFRGDAQPIVGEAMPQTGRAQPGDDVPSGNPLKTANIVMTQGYDVGSHAPAAIWGGVDLAIDGNGDGEADPDGTWNAPIYATHAGITHLRPDSWPGGNYLAIEGEHYKTAYAHLKGYAVQDGQWVERGQVIGYVGSTGQASGPHLHYEVWQDGVNVNPLDFDALDRVE